MTFKTYTKKNAVKTAIPKLFYKKSSSKPAFTLKVQSLDGVFSYYFQIDVDFKQFDRYYESVLISSDFDDPKFRSANIIQSNNIPKSELTAINRMIHAFIKNHLTDYVKQHKQFFKHCQALKNHRKNLTNIWDSSKKQFRDPIVEHEFSDADSGYALTSFSSEEHDSSSAGKIELQDLSYTLQKDGYAKASNLVNGMYDDIAKKILGNDTDKIKTFATSGASVGYGDIHEDKNGKIVHDKSKKPVSRDELLKYAEANYWNAIMSSTLGFTTSKSVAESYGEGYYTSYRNKLLNISGYAYWN